ncbi:helicase-associated domain-containing protein [bacterium]|nr:helicase-associated domain-containing protein [bacterium]
MPKVEYYATYEEALKDGLRVETLKKLVNLTKLTPNSGRKDDLIAVLLRYMSGENLRKVWAKLDHLQKAAIAEVVHSSKNFLDSFNFYAKYGDDPNWGTYSKYNELVTPTPLCLFFSNGIMADDLKARLKAFVPPPRAARLNTLATLPDKYQQPYEKYNWKTEKTKTYYDELVLTIHETETTAQHELLAVLRLVDAGKVSISDKTNRPSKTALATLSGVLDGVDFYPVQPVKNKWDDENAGPIRAFAWPLLIQAGGLAERSGSKLQLTSAGRKALSLDPAQTIRTLWTKWQKTTLLDELSRIDPIKGQTGKAKRHLTAVAARRMNMNKALAQCPVGGWFLVDDFYHYLYALNIPFEVTRNAWGLYIADANYGSLGYQGGLNLLERRYLFCLLLEYVATLGLIDVALSPPAHARRDFHAMWGTDDLFFLSRYDGLIFLRINALGAFCLGIAQTFAPRPPLRQPVFVVQPSLEIVAPSEKLSQADRLALDSYAVNTSDYTWRLSQEKLLNAVDGGRSITEIKDFLMAKSDHELPDTVTHLLADVAEKCSQLHDKGLVRLIECADPALATLIAHDSQAGKHCLRAGERHLVVHSSSETAFKSAIRRLGYIIAPQNSESAK